MILCTSSLKGGVGKTTIAAFLAQALRAKGLRVLSVDLDHNNNLTDYYIRYFSPESVEKANIRHVLTGTLKLGPWLPGPDSPTATWRTDLGDIIPATPSLATVGYELAHDPGAVLRLRSGLRKLLGASGGPYDHIIIDTPPALTLELSAGLYAADLVLVPVSASRWTVQGYQVIASEVAKVGDALGTASPRIFAVPSMVSDTEAQDIRSASVWTATMATIHRDPAIRAAATEGRTLREGTHGAESFADLAREVVG